MKNPVINVHCDESERALIIKTPNGNYKLYPKEAKELLDSLNKEYRTLRFVPSRLKPGTLWYCGRIREYIKVPENGICDECGSRDHDPKIND